PYPLPLKQRVHSKQGHLANGDAARFLAGLVDSSLEYVVLAHLSETNNLPEIALERVRTELRSATVGFEISLAAQGHPTRLFSVE
ncbi:MAG: MBL fold metallo-hydrolase, partial [Desulfocapsa sp.]